MTRKGTKASAATPQRGSEISATHLGRRQAFKSVAALVAATATPVLDRRITAQSRSVPRVVFSDTNAVVEITSGKIRGYTEGGIHTFKGIPYAAPPIGDLRFMRPETPKPWTSVRDTLHYGPACPQATGRYNDLSQFFFEFAERQYVDEDCLRLNVWTPGLNDQRKRPVMFWLHGGGFVFGSSFELPSYDGRNLAQRGDVVVVSINHRLNAFGFLYLAEYGKQFSDSVNVGMLDIVAGLQWVHDNIATFGGDPDNVTIFGQSGGGAKVNFLLAMPSARGLFHKAIVQSATPFATNERSIEFSARQTAAMLREFNLTAGTIEDLRNVPADVIRGAYMRTYFQVEFELDAIARWGRLTAADLREIDSRQTEASGKRLVALLEERYGWDAKRAQLEVAKFTSRRYSDNNGPIADGRSITEAPFKLAAPRISADVPMLIGHTLNEGFGPGSSAGRELWTETDMRAELARQPTPVSDSVVETLRRAYPGVKPVEIFVHTANSGGLRYRIDTVTQATQKSALRAAPAYIYTFAWKTNVLDGRPRAFHRSEIPFVFDNTDRCAHQTGGTEEARVLAARMSDAWIAFARTGSPNHSGIPIWPTFDPVRVPTMFFDNTCEVKYDHDRDARQAFAQLLDAAR
jgi:para-nitrobenzyl esterase